MTHERTQYLLTRYISNSITKEELEELKIQINISDDEKVLYELSALWENHPIEDIQDPCYVLPEYFYYLYYAHWLPIYTWINRHSHSLTTKSL